MDYLPRFLMSTRPPGDNVYEVLVVGEDAVGVLNKVTEVFSQSGVNFISSHGQVDEAAKLFANAFFCDLSKAKMGPDELRRKLASLPFVRDVKVAPMHGAMHEEFMFPMSTVFDGRVLMVGASAFGQVEGRLVEIFGSAGEVMAYEQGRAYSVATLADMEDYRKKVGATWDLGNIMSWIRAQGWAVAEITETPELYGVKLSSIPTLKGERVSAGLGRFLTGMMVGMLEYHAGQRLAADPTDYDPASNSYSFKVRKQAKRPQ
ncbi:MAG: hypothetical protein JRN57_01730 [Nitrososphaerota archaeon]|nr:hypothetical protein [Nitrososphaerota archaeon]